MKLHINRIILFIGLLFLSGQVLFSQAKISKNNYTGAWVTPTSWTPTWAVPQTNINSYGITINGYITLNGSLNFTGNDDLIINDTLVINGDLTLGDKSNLTINNGILIVRGNLIADKHAEILTNGYIIVTGDYNKAGPNSDGTFKSNNNPTKVFIGGSVIPSSLTDDKTKFSALNCTSPANPYAHSHCSSGDMIDLANDPIYPFFQSTCIAKPIITAGGSTTFCNGGSVTLSSSVGVSYLWSNGSTTQSINVSSSGSYTVRITSATGCQSTASLPAVVTVNALPATPTITAGGPTTFCAGGSVTLTSSAGSTYLWSTGATSASINVTTSGSYTIRVTNASGCQSAVSVATIITVNALPVTPTITAGGPTTFCAGGSVTLTSSAGSTYLWSTGATTASIVVTSEGSFTVRVTNANGCQSAASVASVVTVNALPVTPTITAGGPTTFCASGNVTLTSSAGTSYLWSNGATTASINVSTSGSYSVRVTNAIGCQSAASSATVVTVNALPATPTITAGGPTTFCAGGSVTLTSSAGSTYLWSTGATTASINVTTSGSYTVRVTNADGCQSAASSATIVTVNALPATPTITAGGPTTFCAGGSVTLTSSAGTSYLWSTGATTASINITSSGSYTVRMTNANGCQSAASVATTVTVNALPAAPTITAGGPTTFCAGGSVTLTSSAGSTYLWSTGATTATINVTTSGSYTVRVTNAIGCQSAASSATVVTVNALPVTPTITAGGPTTLCAGGSVTLTSGAGSSYLWSTGATTASINVTSSGSYTVRVTNANGCQSAASAATVVTVNALPVVNAGTDVTILNGTSTPLNATVTGTGPFTYSWSPAGQLVNSFIEDPTTVNLPATTIFTLTATSTTTTCSNSANVTITITGGALTSAPTAAPGTICAGEIVQLNAVASGGNAGSYTFTWTSLPAGFSSAIADPTANPVVNTTYWVSVFDGFTTVNSSVLVTVNALPATPIITPGGLTTFCLGGNVTLTSSAATTYLWSNGATTASINVAAAGSYSVIVTNASGCQSATSAATLVTVNSLPATPTITPGGATTFCAGSSVTLTSSAGTSYLWSNTATTASINVSTAGSYTVRVTNANGCQSASSSPIVVTVNALPATPTITAGGPTTFCIGGNVILTSSAGTGYLWSNAATTLDINITSTGSYTVQVTDINGCQSAPSVATAVTVNTLPATPTISAGGPTTFCAGGSVILTSSAGANYLWSTAAITSGINITTSGSYSVQITDGNGCQSAPSAATVVTVNSLPVTPTITAVGPTTFCAGGSVTLTSSAGVSYLWSNGATTPGINVTTAGSYTVSVTNASGCQSASSVATIVTVNALPATPTITAGGPITFCAGDFVTLTSSAGSTYIWSTGATTASVDVTSTGSFTVRVTNANGCQSAASAASVVTVNALPATPTITAGGPTTFCVGGSVTLTSSAGSTYLWSNGATTPGIIVTTSGSYSVRVTNAIGCQSAPSAATVVTVNILPSTPTITAGGPTTFCAGGSVTLTSSAGVSYLWSNGATTPGINVTLAGSYTVLVTNASVCQSPLSVATIVTVNALPVTPTITTGGPTTFCNGESVTLTSSAASDYLWSTGEITQGINIITPGSYTVRVTNSSGCQSAASAATDVTINALPAIPAIIAGGPTTFCAGDSVTLTSSEGSTYLWATGATTASINIATIGSFTVRITNANGCQSAASAAKVVTVDELPAAIASSNSPVCIGNEITLVSSGGISYSWTGPNGFTNLTQSPTISCDSTIISGIYSVIVTSANGCKAKATADITINALPIVNISSNNSMCLNDQLTLTANIVGGTYNITNGSGSISGNILTATGTGDINIVYTCTNVCTSSAMQTIIVNELPIPDAGFDQELKFVFKTQFGATLSSFETGEWSLISGSGHLSDIQSPTSEVSNLSLGENIFLWTVRNASCTASSKSKIIVADLFIPSVITPNGDDYNQFFEISALFGGEELIIFNSWGNLEYSNSNYLNNWDGQNNNGVELPTDTYFYILKFENGIIKKGSVLVLR